MTELPDLSTLTSVLENDKPSELLKLESIQNFHHSKQDIKRAIDENELSRKLDIVWRAYCSVEFGIGVSRLIHFDSEEKKVGMFRELGHSMKIGTKSSKNEQKGQLNENLKQAEIELECSIRSYDERKFDVGIEQARKSRDILKMILLESKKKTFKG